MTRLKAFDLLALGFMTFALFLGAGNIIFPPSAGLDAGANITMASIGFLLTGVGLPLLTVVALARVGGGMPALTQPMGRWAGVALAVAVYLAIGPLFATPRTAVVSFEVGVLPFLLDQAGQITEADKSMGLLTFSSIFFALVLVLALMQGRLIDTLGKLITPVLIIALLVLGCSAFILFDGEVGAARGAYVEGPLLAGFIAGYQTMDALGALVFGVVIATAIRSRGITEPALITRYSIIAVIIAAICLALVYLSLFYLGAASHELAGEATNGAQILTGYVNKTFGTQGIFLLAVVIVLACLTTAVGLMAACGEYFSELLGLSYRLVVCVFSGFSLLVSNVGLEQLIAFSVPVLIGLYPLAIVLVMVSLADKLWNSTRRILVPVMAVTFVFALIDGLLAGGMAKAYDSLLQAVEGTSIAAVLASFGSLSAELYQSMPFASAGMAWLVPALIVLILAIVADRVLGKPNTLEQAV